MSKPNDKIREFVVAYFECMLFAEIARGVPEDTVDSDFATSCQAYGFDIDDIDAKCKIAHIRQCIGFIDDNALRLGAVGTMEQHGHDFWLTRNHHGAGFWDRGYGKRGQRLTESAHAYGSADVSIQDGKVYVS